MKSIFRCSIAFALIFFQLYSEDQETCKAFPHNYRMPMRDPTPLPLATEAPSFLKKKVSCDGFPHRYRVTIRNLEGTGVGYNVGYSSLDLFFSGKISSSNYGFLDARGHVFNNGKWAVNGGLGLRTLPSSIPYVFGVNAFYDFRKTNHYHFNQLGAGFEALGTKWDFRLNGYLPLGAKTHRYSIQFWEFQEHNAIFKNSYEFALPGADLEIGRELFTRGNYGMHATLGGYYFGKNHGKQAAGGFFRIKTDLTRYVTLEGQGSYDSLFSWRGFGQLSLNIPFGGARKLKNESHSCRQNTALANRIVEKVERFEIIVKGTRETKMTATNPLTEGFLNFIFVDNLRGTSDGSFENPYRTLAEAENNSSPYDVIYVFAGNGTASGMDQGIALQDYQQFIGSGGFFIVNTPKGLQTIPAQTTQLPLLTQTSGTSAAVALANYNTVANLYIDHANGAAIENSSPVNSATLTRLVLTNNGQSVNTPEISIGNASSFYGNLVITDSVISDTTGTNIGLRSAIEISANSSNTLNSYICNNTILTDFHCIGVTGLGTSTQTLTIQGNTLTSNSGASGIGINISYQDTANIQTTIANNQCLLANYDVSVFSSGTGTLNGTINNNLFSNASTGVILSQSTAGTINASFTNNTFQGNSSGDFDASQSNGAINLRIVNNRAPDFGYTVSTTGGGPGTGITVSEFFGNTGNLIIAP